MTGSRACHVTCSRACHVTGSRACHMTGSVSCCRASEELGVKHEQLTLIPPQFETPLPPLQPAVCVCVCVCVCACVRVYNMIASDACLQVVPPTFHELPPPSLDLFDLDEHFSSEQARIAQLTNKCEWVWHHRPCPLWWGDSAYAL